MNARGLLFVSIALAVVVAGGAALLSDPVAAQKAEDGIVSTRYRVTVVRVDLPSGSSGAPLTVREIGKDLEGARFPASRRAAGGGHFFAIPYPHDLLSVLVARGGAAKVIFRGETESDAGSKTNLFYGQSLPVLSRDIRGEQVYVTTQFKRIGVRVELTRTAIDLHAYTAEFSTVSAQTVEGDPVIAEFSTSGRIDLPDGYTAVLSFMDRVDGSMLGLIQPDPDEDPIPLPDKMTEYLLLLTRLDSAQ